MIACSIIIPSYNTVALTESCLWELLRHPPSCSYEILLVDNHSPDGTADRIAHLFPNVRVLRNPNNAGFSKACNRGARNAHGRYLCFLNSDAQPLPGSFDQMVAWMEGHPQTGIVGPALVGPNGEILQMSWGWLPLLMGELIQQYFAPYVVCRSRLRQRLIRFLQRKNRRVPSICGACLMIRRLAFNQIHGFDDHFELYFVDSDLCCRCIEAGWHIYFLAETRIIHHLGQSTSGGWSATSLIYQQSHIAYYKKHAPVWAVWLLKAYLWLKWLRLAFVVLLRSSDEERGRRYWRAYRDIITEKRSITLDEGY